MSGVERFGSNLTLLSLSFARRGDGNLTLSLCDVPLLRKERDVLATPKQGEVRTGGRETAVSTRIATSPCLLRRHPSPSTRRGRFGGSRNRVRSG